MVTSCLLGAAHPKSSARLTDAIFAVVLPYWKETVLWAEANNGVATRNQQKSPRILREVKNFINSAKLSPMDFYLVHSPAEQRPPYLKN